MRTIIAIVLTLLSAGDVDAAFAPFMASRSGVIAFACIGSDLNSHICVDDVLTGSVQTLTSGSCQDVAPDWSFDGLKIVFERDCGNDHDIYRINSDGTSLTQVTTSTLAFIPSWTPTGQIVYMQEVYQPGPTFCTNSYDVPCTDLRLINADGTGDAEILASSYTNGSAVSSINISPHATPDGASVLFACGPYGDGAWGGPGIQICSIPLAAGNVTQTPTLLSSVTSAVSSDPYVSLQKVGGQYQVVFDSTRNGNNLNVFTMNLDGSNVVQLTTFVEPVEGQDAGFSPNVSQISFEHDVSAGAASIWIMNSDGSNQRDTGIACNLSGCKPRFKP